MNRCSICERKISGTAWLCHACAKQWELEKVSYEKWPEWAKYCKINEEQKRRAQKETPQVLTFSECPEAEALAYGEWNDDEIP